MDKINFFVINVNRNKMLIKGILVIFIQNLIKNITKSNGNTFKKI